MAAIELYKQDGKQAGVFFCSECRSVFVSEEQANGCHGDRFCGCGEKLIQRFVSLCSACESRNRRAEEREREAQRFEKALKVQESEYASDMVSDGDNFYDSVEEAVDQYLEGQEPEYVWATKNVGVPLANSDGIVESILENMWEDADSSDLIGLEELDAAIAKFNEANKAIRVYQVDYGTAVLVEKKRAATK
jgi:hypothetical protein